MRPAGRIFAATKILCLRLVHLMKSAIYLNDGFFLDGGDPNGHAGIG
jgi:hypothetical protein